jgi:hypothetical protein
MGALKAATLALDMHQLAVVGKYPIASGAEKRIFIEFSAMFPRSTAMSASSLISHQIPPVIWKSIHFENKALKTSRSEWT